MRLLLLLPNAKQCHHVLNMRLPVANSTQKAYLAKIGETLIFARWRYPAIFT
jgi:hypothetical protein